MLVTEAFPARSIVITNRSIVITNRGLIFAISFFA
jgi:hypothetical protein